MRSRTAQRFADTPSRAAGRAMRPVAASLLGEVPNRSFLSWCPLLANDSKRSAADSRFKVRGILEAIDDYLRDGRLKLERSRNPEPAALCPRRLPDQLRNATHGRKPMVWSSPEPWKRAVQPVRIPFLTPLGRESSSAVG